MIRDEFERIHGDIDDASYEVRAEHIAAAVTACGIESNVHVVMKPWAPYGGVTGVEVTDLYADEPGTGGGTKVMTLLAAMADELGMPVYLRPSSHRNREFYARFNFQQDTRNFGFLARYPAFKDEDEDDDRKGLSQGKDAQGNRNTEPAGGAGAPHPGESTQSLTHARALSNALTFATCSDRVTAHGHMSRSVEACISFIKAGVSTPGPVICAFIDTPKWGYAPEIRQLFAAYVKSGYIRVDEPLSKINFPPSPHRDSTLPLEAAVRKGNLSAFDLLLDNAADTDKVQGSLPSLCGDVPNRKSGGDILDFISQNLPNGEVASSLKSMFNEHIMRRQLKRVAAVDLSARPSAPISRRMANI